MGQQQLLLLVLGIVIVGLAVVVGLQAFERNQEQAAGDAMVNDALRMISDSQVWALKPKLHGGGQGAYTGLTLDAIGYSTGGNAYYEGYNARFAIAVSSPTQIAITFCNKAQSAGGTAVVTGIDEANITMDAAALEGGRMDASDCPS
ncbi:hypothetical protein [Rubricoccus marinus]|uniref:Type 4 secretion system PilS N-terminal domain-containing protein n=1 Tax=Rubricoccus marinus TaxID=716817 RepID=A0A259U0Z5_9BACT|nr:hypothetical protein [Rubricoccus marinus]OZC03669.1 hypothetical protein BSZ36_12170 [Rubricoccus marinus]